MKQLETVFKGLEFVGALVSAVSLVNLPEEELETLTKKIETLGTPRNINDFTEAEIEMVRKHLTDTGAIGYNTSAPVINSVEQQDNGWVDDFEASIQATGGNQ
jgi:hypothetical protein